MKPATKLILLFFFLPMLLWAQEPEIDRLIKGELKMTFPSIYFKHNSVDYAQMPYTVDSCFQYISVHFKDNINSLVIWRDTLEPEALTGKRIKKLNQGLSKYIPSGKVNIQSMGNQQKISRFTISLTSDSTQINYLLSLNSVLDFSKSRHAIKKKRKYRNHIERPRIWCLDCWKSGFHIKDRRRLRKTAKDKKNQQTAAK